jgi:hypothetical protein
MMRLADIERFYALLCKLEERVGGKRTLANFRTFHDWQNGILTQF